MHYGSIMGPSMSEEVDPDDPRFMDYTRQFLELVERGLRGGRASTPGMERETEVHLAIARVFADHDALVCPTFGGLGLRAGEEYADGIDVAGQHLELYIFAALTPVFNVASRHPVLAVPSGIAPNGVPTGVQVVARPVRRRHRLPRRGRGRARARSVARPVVASLPLTRPTTHPAPHRKKEPDHVPEPSTQAGWFSAPVRSPAPWR